MNPQLTRWDERLAQALQRPVVSSAWVRRLALVLAHSGDGWFWFPGLALAAWWSRGASRAALVHTLLTLLAVALVVTLLKHLVRRPRPQSPWGNIYRKTDPHSFPSGHAARGAALMVLAWVYLPSPWAALVSLWAVGLAWSRAAIGVHYPSDVLAGGLLGVLLALGSLAFGP